MLKPLTVNLHIYREPRLRLFHQERMINVFRLWRELFIAVIPLPAVAQSHVATTLAF
ncbi:hypothetical protein ACFOGG_14320 [Brenneria rubrifaciens]|uniref:hypothetical protein n=1 Tax=Brenneria rubrifaciens TaxID=55213 RepID=UPI003608606A